MRLIALLILLSPVLGPLGYDVYLAIANKSGSINFSTLGELITAINPNGIELIKAQVSEQVFTQYVSPVLEQLSLLIGGILMSPILVIVLTYSSIRRGHIFGTGQSKMKYMSKSQRKKYLEEQKRKKLERNI